MTMMIMIVMFDQRQRSQQNNRDAMDMLITTMTRRQEMAYHDHVMSNDNKQ